MSRSTSAERAERLNAAFDLLAQGRAAAQATAALSEEFALSRRQANRYVREAQGIKRPVVVSGPAVAVTVKVPEEVAQQLRQHARVTNSTIGEVIARALAGLLARERRRG